MIELPEKFKLDTEGNDTYLIPLVVIDDRIYLSTNKVSLEKHYNPLIKKIGNIRESIDHNNKTFRISAVKISLFNQKSFSKGNYKYRELSLGDNLFSQDILNKSLSIYYKSQSAESLDDCLKVYSGYIKDVDESKETVTLDIEDITEKILNKELPQRFTPTEDTVPEKYRDKPIPIVYGVVDRCPLAYISHQLSEVSNYFGHFESKVDDFYIKIIDSPKVYSDNVYADIVKEANLFDAHKEATVFQNTGITQYDISDDNAIVFARTGTYEMQQGSFAHGTSSPLSVNMVEVEQYSDARYSNGHNRVGWDYSDNADASDIGDDVDDGWGDANIGMYQEVGGTTPSTDVNGSYFMVKDFGELPNPVQESARWLWGWNTDYFGSNVFDELSGTNNLEFEVDDFFSSSDMVSEFSSMFTEASDAEPTQVNSWFNLLYNINTKVTYSGHSNRGTIDITNTYPSYTGYTHPIIRLVFADGGVELMDHSQLSTSTGGGTGDDEYQYFQKSNINIDSSENRVLTQDIGVKTFSLGSGKWITLHEGEADEFALLDTWYGGSNSLGYINTTSLQVYKRAILKDFNSKDLYAYAEGRVDDVNGRYTGIEIVVLSGQSDIVIRQDQGVSSRRLTPASRTKAKVISSKTIKKITKGGY